MTTVLKVAYHEIDASTLDPMVVAEKLLDTWDQQGLIFEVGLSELSSETYSLIALNPLPSAAGGLKSLNDVREQLKTYAIDNTHPNACFHHGIMGYVSYDAIRLFESIADRHDDLEGLPLIEGRVYQTLCVFNPIQKTLLISQIIQEGQDAQAQINALIQAIHLPCTSTRKKTGTVGLSPDQDPHDGSEHDFIQAVHHAKKAIMAGDAFQIVLSRCFKKNYSVHPFKIYCALRRLNPSPYLFYLNSHGRVILGASPETLVRVSNGQAFVHVIAGTCPRSEQKGVAEAYLLNHPKECAEHRMLIDLARNDLGKICQPGSIHLSEYMKVQDFSHLSHIRSVVQGRLREGEDALNVFQAVFPAGTVSGAPKIAAMNQIDALEDSKRGLYAGAIFRLNHVNDLDSCIAIRMAVLKEGVASIRTGAGIVFHSDPLSEACETLYKAQALFQAIEQAQEDAS